MVLRKSALKADIADDHLSTVITALIAPHGIKPHQLEFILIKDGLENCR